VKTTRVSKTHMRNKLLIQ